MRDHNTAAGREASAREHGSRVSGETPTRLASDMESGGTTSTAIQPRDELRVLGPYEIIRMLGQGGMGMVLLGYDPALDRSVAIKLLRSDRNDEDSRKRFVREARAAAAIQHDNVVTIHSVANPRSGLPYFVMPYIAGPTLRQQLDTDTQLDPVRAAQFAIEIASGLSAAHAAGLVHRDIKPDNVMLDTMDDRAKILDFGLVRLPGSDGVTQTGTSAGTPEYMSPEQIDDPTSVDQRTDVYSLGVSLYEMLTGARPFRGTSHMVMQQVLTDDPRAPRKLNDRIPRDLEVICLRAMEKDPARRYQTAAELGDDLKRWTRGEAIMARPIGPAGRLLRWRQRQPALANLATALVLVIAVAIGAVIVQWRRAEFHLAEARRQESRRIAQEAQTAEASRQVVQASKKVEQASQQAETASREAEQARGQILSVILQSQIRQDTRQDNAARKFFEALSSMPMTVIEQHRLDPAKASEVAAAYMGLGQMKWRAGDPQAAFTAYTEARDRYTALSRAEPDDAKLRHVVATAHRSIGELQGELEDQPEALLSHQQAREILRDLVRGDPAAPNYLLDLANSEIAIGTLHAKLEHHDAAVTSHEHALAVLRRIERASNMPTMQTIGKDLAIANRKLGDGLRLHATAESTVEVYARAIELGRAAHTRLPGQVDVQSELAIALNQRGECLMEVDRLDEAARSIREAISLQEQALKRSPLTEGRRWLRLHFRNLTQIELRRGNISQAVDAISQRQTLLPGDPEAVYECARGFARCLAMIEDGGSPEMSDEIRHLALEALRHAIEVGFDDGDRLQRDPTFSELCELAEFRRLANSILARSAD